MIVEPGVVHKAVRSLGDFVFPIGEPVVGHLLQVLDLRQKLLVGAGFQQLANDLFDLGQADAPKRVLHRGEPRQPRGPFCKFYSNKCLRLVDA
jgi:hypothetical protein